jgi:amidase
MLFDEYRRHDGLGLAELVARGEVTAAELLGLALARTEAVNPKLNAIVVRMDDIARRQAKALHPGPFAGVPFLTKDLEQDFASVSSSNGCRALRSKNMAAPHHAEITQRWLNAGIVIFGRTNTPEFGLTPVTEPLAWGPARNPWDLACTPGGSSGGSAAAVAAGITPMAGGNDVGGSIRIPAAACGLFGFKPGRARTPWGPLRGEMMHGAAINHALTRSVRDSAAMLDATHGAELAAGFHIAPPERSYLEEVGRPPGKLRIGFSARSPIGAEVSAAARLAVDQTAMLLEGLGHEVEAAEPEIAWEALFEDVMNMMYVNSAVLVAQVRRVTGCGDAGFEPDTLIMARLGRAIRADQYAASLARWGDYSRAMNAFHLRYDIYLTPTLAAPPWAIGETSTPAHEQKLVGFAQALGLSRALLGSQQLRDKVRETLKYVPFTELANLTGAPAMSLPLHWTASGLPLGVHFMAGPSQEGLLFSLAAQLEQAQPWFDRHPSI